MPIEDPRAQQELTRALDTMVSSNVHAWELKADGEWQRMTRKERRAGARDANAPSSEASEHGSRDGRASAPPSRPDHGGAQGDRRPAEQNAADEGRRRRRWREHVAPARRRNRCSRRLCANPGGAAPHAARRRRRASGPADRGEDRALRRSRAQEVRRARKLGAMRIEDCGHLTVAKRRERARADRHSQNGQPDSASSPSARRMRQSSASSARFRERRSTRSRSPSATSAAARRKSPSARRARRPGCGRCRSARSG